MSKLVRAFLSFLLIPALAGAQTASMNGVPNQGFLLPSPFSLPAITKGRVISGISKCEMYPGGDVSAQVNACVLDAIGQTNGNTTGIADATALGISATTLSEIDAGNSSGAKGMLIVPCTGSWQASMTGGTFDTLKQFSGFDVVSFCPLSGVTANFYIGATPSSLVNTIYEVVGTSNQYVHASGFQVLNSADHATASHYGVIVDGTLSHILSDGSTILNVDVFDTSDYDSTNHFGGPVLFRNVCCGLSWNFSAFNAGGNGIPVTLQASTSSVIQKINFLSDTMVNPGSDGGNTLPILSCTDSRSGKNSYADIAYGYTETNSTNTTGNLVSSTCQHIGFQHYGVYSNIANNAEQFSSTLTGVALDDIHFYQGVGTWVYPVVPAPGLTTNATGDYGKVDPSDVPNSLGPTVANGLSSDNGSLNLFNAFGGSDLCVKLNGGCVYSQATANGEYLSDSTNNDVVIVQPNGGKILLGSISNNSTVQITNGLMSLKGTFSLPSTVAPTMAAGAAAGTTPACTTVTGNNNTMTVTCTTGTATPTTGILATITFNGTLTSAPNSCLVGAKNQAASNAMADVFTSNPSTTGFTLNVGGTAFAISTQYIFGIHCL